MAVCATTIARTESTITPARPERIHLFCIVTPPKSLFDIRLTLGALRENHAESFAFDEGCAASGRRDTCTFGNLASSRLHTSFDGRTWLARRCSAERTRLRAVDSRFNSCRQTVQSERCALISARSDGVTSPSRYASNRDWTCPQDCF